MIGNQQLIIDQSNFLKGMSSGAQISDGGYSSETEAVNPIVTPGVLYAPAIAVDSDTDARLTGNIIATSPDMVSSSATNRLLVADNGSYYSYNGTKIPAVAFATDAGATYAKGFTDIITFAGEAYVTTKEKIKRWTNPSTITDLTGGAFTNTGHPHPAIVFENNAFYGDRNLLLRQTAANGAPATILTLSVDQTIIALGIDPGTGKMLISTSNSLDVSNTLPAIHRVLWYDGFSDKTLKSAIVNDIITAFYPHEGIVYVGYGQNLGYLNGAGITFLRKLNNVTLVADDLPHKHSFSHIGNTLYVVDGNKILAYGEIVKGGGKVFYYCYKNYFGTAQTNKFKTIFYAGSNKIGISSATNKFSTLDITSTANLDSFDFYSTWY